MKRYRIGADLAFGGKAGDVVELELSPEEEADHLAAGRLELLERRYRVIGLTEVCETRPGQTFVASLPAWQEQALIAGGHIEIVPEKQKE